MAPMRISVLGIDGSGKSSTTLKAIFSLSHFFSICKTGRTPFFIQHGEVSHCLPKVASYFETLFKRVDATKNRRWIGFTRLAFVIFQGWLEPYMVKKYHPDLVMTTRCMIIDSAIYSTFYYPSISQKLTIAQKLKLAQRCSRLPFRDLYFFLHTSIPTAMERIHRRIAEDHPERSTGREYWLHLHEHNESLRVLDRTFRETLPVAQRMASFTLQEVNTEKRTEDEVARAISKWSLAFAKDGRLERWNKR